MFTNPIFSKTRIFYLTGNYLEVACTSLASLMEIMLSHEKNFLFNNNEKVWHHYSFTLFFNRPHFNHHHSCRIAPTKFRAKNYFRLIRHVKYINMNYFYIFIRNKKNKQEEKLCKTKTQKFQAN